jgi:hypothetical protein
MKQLKPLVLAMSFVVYTGLLPSTTPTMEAATPTSEPFTISSAVPSATPFNITVPTTTSAGKAVKTVVIEYVTSDCNTAPGVASIGAAKMSVLFSGTFSFYTLPFEAGMSFINATEFVSAQKTLIFADPGSIINYGLSAGQPSCTVAFSGHLIS